MACLQSSGKQKDEAQGQERRIAAGCGEADDGGTERYPFEELEKFLAEGEGTAGGRIMIGIRCIESTGRGRSRKEAGGGEGGETGWRFRDRTKTGLPSGCRIRDINPSGRASYIISIESDFGKAAGR